MRTFFTRGGRLALIAGASLLAAGCGGGNEAAADNNMTALDANLMLEQPGNDQSAVESAANATEPVPADLGNTSTDSNAVLGDTSGGDTGGNTVDSNISGM